MIRASPGVWLRLPLDRPSAQSNALWPYRKLSLSRASAFALSSRHASALGRICPRSVRRGNAPPTGRVGWRRKLNSLAPLSQRQLAVSVRRHRVAMLAESRVATAVAHDLAGLLALDIAVDAGH